MAQAEPVGIGLEVFVVYQDATPPPPHCRDFAAPDHAADLLGAVGDDSLLRDLVRCPEQSFHVGLRAKESRLEGGGYRFESSQATQPTKMKKASVSRLIPHLPASAPLRACPAI